MKNVSSKSENKFQRVMQEFGRGTLKSHGKPVTDKNQALAIAFSEARKIYPNYGMMKKAGEVKEPVAVKGLFSLDAIEGKTFPGYTFGDDWNGWAVPYFESEEANAIGHELGGKKGYDKPPYFMFPEEGPGSDLSDGPYEQEKIQTEDGEKLVYPIGAYNWTWNNDLLKNGGGITGEQAAVFAQIYKTGTAKQLWAAWNPDNRIHFLMDHSTEYFELMGDDFYKSSKGFSALTYDTLPSPIRKSLLIHHAQGMYGNGGGISRFWDSTKKHSKAAYEKSKELAGKGYDKTKEGYQKAKAYTEQKIHDKKKNIALDVLDETRGNADTKDQSRILNAASDLVEDQYASGGEILKRLPHGLGKEFIQILPSEIKKYRKGTDVYSLNLTDGMDMVVTNDTDIKSLIDSGNFVFGIRKYAKDGGSMASGGEVYLDTQRRKYVLIDTRTKKLWANEFFATPEEAIEFANQNKIKIVQKPIGGRGFFGLEKGERIKSVNDVSEGDILLAHSKQFNADNTIKVTEKRTYGTITHLSGIYWNPITNKRIGDENFGIDPELGMDEYYWPKSKKITIAKLSPSKQKLLDRINTLKATKANADESAQKAIQNKIDVLQRQFDYNPSAKEKAMANKGKFALDVPASYSKAMYKKLWAIKVFPQIHKLNGTHSIVVNSKANLDKAYEVFSDMLKEKKEKVPSLASISRKL